MALLIFLPAVVNRESASAKDVVREKEEWQRQRQRQRERERGKEGIRLKQRAIIKPRPRRSENVRRGKKKLHAAATKNNYAAVGRQQTVVRRRVSSSG